jgi:hypothetical protein
MDFDNLLILQEYFHHPAGRHQFSYQIRKKFIGLERQAGRSRFVLEVRIKTTKIPLIDSARVQAFDARASRQGRRYG